MFCWGNFHNQYVCARKADVNVQFQFGEYFENVEGNRLREYLCQLLSSQDGPPLLTLISAGLLCTPMIYRHFRKKLSCSIYLVKTLEMVTLIHRAIHKLRYVGYRKFRNYFRVEDFRQFWPPSSISMCLLTARAYPDFEPFAYFPYP